MSRQMQRRRNTPTFGPKVYAIWNPVGGPDEAGAWWQSDGGEYGDSPVVFFDLEEAEAFATDESGFWNDPDVLMVIDVTCPGSPVVVRTCRDTSGGEQDGTE